MPTDPAPPPLDYRNPTHHVTTPSRSNALRIVAWSIGTFFVLLLLISLFIPGGQRARETAQRIKCASNLRQIGSAALLYASHNQGLLPPDLFVIQSEGDLPPYVLGCPSSDHDDPSGSTPAEIKASILSGDHLGYAWVGAGLSIDHLDDNIVLAFDLERHVPKDAERTTGINVLFPDGHSDFVTEPTAKAIWAQFAAGIRPIRLPAAANATTQPNPNQ